MQTVDLEYRTDDAWNEMDNQYLYNLPEEWVGAYVQIFAMLFDEDEDCDDIHHINFAVYGDTQTVIYVNSGDAANRVLSLTPCVVHVPHQRNYILSLITPRLIKWTVYYAILSSHDTLRNYRVETPGCFVRPYMQPCAEMFVILKKDIYVDMIVRHCCSNFEEIEVTQQQQYEIVDSRTLKFAPADFYCLIFEMDVEYVIYIY